MTVATRDRCEYVVGIKGRVFGAEVKTGLRYRDVAGGTRCRTHPSVSPHIVCDHHPVAEGMIEPSRRSVSRPGSCVSTADDTDTLRMTLIGCRPEIQSSFLLNMKQSILFPPRSLSLQTAERDKVAEEICVSVGRLLRARCCGATASVAF